jgi:F-type H+-transporting ATPase subunit delta
VARANPAARDAVGDILRRLPDLAARQRVGQELLSLAAVLARQIRLRSALSDPAVTSRQKVELLDALFGDQVSSAATEAVAAIAEHQRIKGREMPDVIEDVGVQTLLDVADDAGSLHAAQDQLFGFADIVERDQSLRSALTDPALPSDRKRAVVEDLLRDRADAVAVSLLAHWVARDRARDLERVVEDAVAEAAGRRQRVVAQVRAAVPLDAGQRSQLAEALHRVTGSPVDLRLEIDPDVVGSLSVRIGDEVFDGSVKRQLELARERFGIS